MSFHKKNQTDKDFNPRPDHIFYGSLLLSIKLAQDLLKEKATRATLKKEKELRDASAADDENSQDVNSSERIDDNECSSTGQQDLPFCTRTLYGSECMQIFDQEAVQTRYGMIQSLSGDRDERTKIKARLDNLKKNGNLRLLAKIPKQWRDALDTLESNHPNFYEIIDYIRGVFAIAERCDGIPAPANILIDGPPGCGKTYFTKKLAECLGTEFYTLHLETMQTAAEIVGDSDTYRSSAPGALYNALVDGMFANPVFLLDEICKMGGDERFRPQTALYRVFERETAKTFTDNAEPWLKLDLSRVFFICTSNNSEAVDFAILSRLKKFTVEMPSDPTKIIENIFQELKRERPSAFTDVTIEESATSLLAKQSPRRIRQLLEDAIGHALYRQRTKVVATDIQLEEPRRTMGF